MGRRSELEPFCALLGPRAFSKLAHPAFARQTPKVSRRARVAVNGFLSYLRWSCPSMLPMLFVCAILRAARRLHKPRQANKLEEARRAIILQVPSRCCALFPRKSQVPWVPLRKNNLL